MNINDKIYNGPTRKAIVRVGHHDAPDGTHIQSKEQEMIVHQGYIPPWRDGATASEISFVRWTEDAPEKTAALAQIEALCGPDGQNVERLFAKAQQAFWKLQLENNPFPDRAPDPEGAEKARQAIADYTAAYATYQNLVAVLRS